ncbi:hypothetical protein U1Q18_034464 [Sarracenia purpurea var. burkii]
MMTPQVLMGKGEKSQTVHRSEQRPAKGLFGIRKNQIPKQRRFRCRPARGFRQNFEGEECKENQRLVLLRTAVLSPQAELRRCLNPVKSESGGLLWLSFHPGRRFQWRSLEDQGSRRSRRKITHKWGAKKEGGTESLDFRRDFKRKEFL